MSENDYLLEKVSTIENRLENHVLKIEDRLEHIAGLMSAVSSLKERERGNQQSIGELKEVLNHSFERHMESVKRVHDRIGRQTEENEEDIKRCREVLDGQSHELIELDKKVSKWLNRGVGIWVGISALVFLVQSFFTMSISTFRDEQKNIIRQIEEIENQVNNIKINDEGCAIKLEKMQERFGIVNSRIIGLDSKFMKLEERVDIFHTK